MRADPQDVGEVRSGEQAADGVLVPGVGQLPRPRGEDPDADRGGAWRC